MQYKTKRKGYKKYTLYLISLLWIISMGVLGFMLPFFIDSTSVFKASKILIYESKYIPRGKIEEAILQLGGNWLFTTEGILKDILKRKVGNIIEYVDIDREITREGIVLKIRVKEKEPVAIVKENAKVYLIDKDGQILPYLNPKGKYPVIYTDDINKVTNYFSHLYKSLISKFDIREAYITNNKFVLYLKNRNIKIILPAAEDLENNIVRNIEKVLFIINSEGIANAIIDLRFNKFASIKIY